MERADVADVLELEIELEWEAKADGRSGPPDDVTLLSEGSQTDTESTVPETESSAEFKVYLDRNREWR